MNAPYESPRFMPYPPRQTTVSTKPPTRFSFSSAAGTSALSYPPSPPSNSPSVLSPALSEPTNQLVLYNKKGCRPRNDEDEVSTTYARPDKVRAVAGPAQSQLDEVLSLALFLLNITNYLMCAGTTAAPGCSSGT